MADPEYQIQYFNAIIIWLLELHALLRRYIIGTDVNPWFTFDVEKTMIERNVAYGRYKELRRQVNYLVRKYKGLYMKRFLDPNLPQRSYGGT
jgi:hypothetical protein